LKEIIDKSLIIAEQNVELERLRALVTEPTTTNDPIQQGIAIGDFKDTEIEVDAATLDHIEENATYGVLEPVNTPLRQIRASLMPPLLVQRNNH
jgi:hypothetical protein